MKAAVLGTSGYTGLLLVRLLADHPEVREILPVSSSRAGEPMQEVDPGLGDVIQEKLSVSEGRLLTLAEAGRRKPDVVFAALPHLESARLCAPFFESAVVIDLSADFRLRDGGVFKKAYGEPPPREDLLPRAVYGLSEWNREKIKRADLIANPGCYPTASLLPLLPLLKEGLISDGVVINAVSGISGAGRKTTVANLFCERSENISAYSPGKSHRHAWEIEAELKAVSADSSIIFNPHLAPLKRGIAVTTVAGLSSPSGSGGIGVKDIAAVYRDYYGQCPFIVLRENAIPQTRDVRGTNRCDLGWQVEGDKILLFSVIDNLVKGASGQAVQNMNLRFGFEETLGLRVHGEV